jgi:hypothetical protein
MEEHLINFFKHKNLIVYEMWPIKRKNKVYSGYSTIVSHLRHLKLKSIDWTKLFNQILLEGLKSNVY